MDEQTPAVATPETAPAPAEGAEDWSSANEEFSKDKGLDPGKSEEKPAEKKDEKVDEKKPDEKKVEEAKKDPEEKKTPEEKKDPAEDPEKKAEVTEEKKVPEPTEKPSNSDARSAYREMASERAAVAEDVRKELFSDVKNELADADGDPIRTVADVMKLVNPNTSQPFTAEEATIYLFQAQQYLEKQLKDTEKQVEEIAETNVALKDQSDSIRAKYGALLEAMPDLRDQLWAEFQKTLTKDEKTGIIMKAPVSLESFYEIALKPYAQHAARLEAEDAEKAKADAEKAKQEGELKAKKTQSDRQDIFSGGKTDTMDPTEKEWAEAAKDYYEN